MNNRMKKLVGGVAVLSMLLASAPTASAASYSVQPGDSLWKISVKYGISIDQLKKMNNLASDQLLIGQTLNVPDPVETQNSYAQAGDTMWKIAERHGIPLHKLISANPQIVNPNNIWVGLEIKIPKKPDGYLGGKFPLAAGSYTAYSNNYAETRSWSPDGAEVRKHEGVDIFAKEGTPIYNAVEGTIVKAAWNEYGGWRVTVRVDNDTEFYYAHLSKYAAGIKVGVKVSAGQIIGYVGSTGYGPEGTSGKFLPHLHFGIYKRTPAYRAVDPYLYMKWWELG